ncbi:uncharacterized [Tachysurus ichikawai]
MHAENQPGLSASCSVGTKRGARSSVQYKVPEQTAVCILAQARVRGVKTQKKVCEKRNRIEHENLVEISRERRGELERSHFVRAHGTVNPSGVCKEAERRGAHRRGGETLTH